MATGRAKCACGGACYIIPGISGIRASGNALTEAKKVIISVLYGPIPYALRTGEFFAALQGIKSGEQGNSRPDQGISRWSAIWRFAVVDLERCRESEQGRRQIFEVADADLGARGRLCPSESLLHARCRTRRHKQSAFRALHRAHPRWRAGLRIPLSSTGERRTRQPDPTLCPEHLLSSVLFLWHYDYSNQFCLNDRRNSVVPNHIFNFFFFKNIIFSPLPTKQASDTLP